MKRFLSIAWMALCLPELASAAGTPEAAPAVSAAGSLLQVFIGLVAVLLLIAGAAWVAKRLGVTQVGSSNLLRVVSSASVGTRERVVVSKWVNPGWSWAWLRSVNALMTLPKGELPSQVTPILPGNFGCACSK